MLYIQSILKIGAFLSVLIGAVLLYNLGTTSTPIIKSLAPTEEHRYPSSPHVASWKTWFHPLQSAAGSTSKDYRKGWNLLQHLGGVGPWIEKIDEGDDTSDLAPPEGCLIDQIHLVCKKSTFSTHNCSNIRSTG